MRTYVEIVRALCEERKIAVSKLEKDCGFSNGYLNPKKLKTIPYDRAVVIAEYLSVPLETIFPLAETEKAPAESGEREIKAAFFDGMDLTEDEQDDLWQDAKEYFQFKIAQRKRKDGNR